MSDVKHTPAEQHRLKAWRQVWTHKSRDGWEYEYECLWSDGSMSAEITMPRGDVALGALELPMANRGPHGRNPIAPFSLDDVALAISNALSAPYLQAAE